MKWLHQQIPLGRVATQIQKQYSLSGYSTEGNTAELHFLFHSFSAHNEHNKENLVKMDYIM